MKGYANMRSVPSDMLPYITRKVCTYAICSQRYGAIHNTCNMYTYIYTYIHNHACDLQQQAHTKQLQSFRYELSSFLIEFIPNCIGQVVCIYYLYPALYIYMRVHINCSTVGSGCVYIYINCIQQFIYIYMYTCKY